MSWKRCNYPEVHPRKLPRVYYSSWLGKNGSIAFSFKKLNGWVFGIQSGAHLMHAKKHFAPSKGDV